VDTITITSAVAIGLASLDLGPVPGMSLIATLPLSASLRKPVDGQKNHCSDKKCAVFQ
jgi:hypothetical protein